MKRNWFGAALAVGVLLAAAGTADAQVYYSQGYYPSTGSYYYYPSTGSYYYPSTTGYYSPSAGAYSYGTTAYTPGVVQAGTYQDWSGTYGYSPYYGSTYQTYDYSNSGTYGSGPYLNVSPWGVSYGVSPFYNQSYGFSNNWVTPRRVSRWFR
jgi:hypothetical protein